MEPDKRNMLPQDRPTFRQLAGSDGDGSALADTAINPFERLKFWQAMQLKEILTMKTATTLQVV